MNGADKFRHASIRAGQRWALPFKINKQLRQHAQITASIFILIDIKMDSDVLISLVFSKQPLWDKRDKRHCNRKVIDKCWKEISEAMNEDGDSILDQDNPDLDNLDQDNLNQDDQASPSKVSEKIESTKTQKKSSVPRKKIP
ncbi:unnamed protein product [Diatraea saccharalis]|uniref:MADF domain-containing protein n=1 Tax=Diatraea saccharalis TaxID=40085 RepID=A0A9N9WII9_9NEOP|nr:unnamed protein product [Diatraea saccharalis]